MMPKQIRDFYEAKIDDFVKEPWSNDIAKSILIGVRTNIDPELLHSYSNTGTIHILSVSGLHFAILILFINWLLGLFMKESNIRTAIKHSISFLYALITGFSPPVFRSFLMFLLLDVEKKSKVNPSAVNIVFLSAWIILLFDTNQLFDIGFQLSYAAILGIILWQNKMEQKLSFNSEWSTYLWRSTCTLMAATIFTMPLIVFYFHKLSFLGLLSNYLVIPLTLMIMYMGFTMLLFSWIEPVGRIIGHLMSFLIYIQNEVITWFSHLRFASFDSLYLSKIDLVWMMAILIVFNLFLFLKKKYEFRLLLIFILAFTACRQYEQYKNTEISEWYVLPSYRNTAFALASHSKIMVFADSLEPQANQFFVDNLRIKKGLKTEDVMRYPLRTRMEGISMKYGIAQSQHPNFLILCKENKANWHEYIAERDSFVLPNCLGSYYTRLLEEELKSLQKQYAIY
jgi:competence protein ComEC